VLDQTLIEIFTTQVGITGGSNDFKHTVINSEQGDIEGTTTQIVDKDVLLLLLIETVSDSLLGGLVNDPQNVQTRDLTLVLSLLPLLIGEVLRNGDDLVANILTQVVFLDLFHLTKDHLGDLLGGQNLLGTLDQDFDVGLTLLIGDFEGQQLHIGLDGFVLEPPTDQPLLVVDGLGGVVDLLVLLLLTNQLGFALIRGVGGEGDVRGGDPVTLVVGDDLDSPVLVDTDATVGGTEIDTNDRTVDFLFLLLGLILRDEGKGSNLHCCYQF